MNLTDTQYKLILKYLKLILDYAEKGDDDMSDISDIAQGIADKLTGLETELGTFKTDLEKAIADLAAKGVSAADLAALNALSPRVQALTDALTTEDTTVKNADQ